MSPNRAALHSAHCLPDVCPFEISSAAISTWPSVVTTSRGIGGACRKISVPTQPNIANENTNIAIKISQSFLIRNRSFYVVSAATSYKGGLFAKPRFLPAPILVSVVKRTYQLLPSTLLCIVLGSSGRTL